MPPLLPGDHPELLGSTPIIDEAHQIALILERLDEIEKRLDIVDQRLNKNANT